MSEIQIEQVRVDDLMPHSRNARTHELWQIAQISSSIKAYGFVNPVLIDAEGTIIAGHGRVQAAIRLEMETVPCIRLGHLTETEARALMLADNRLAENAGWDQEMLKLELGELRGMGVDLAGIGWTDVDLAGIGLGVETGGAGQGDPLPPSEPPKLFVVVQCRDTVDQRELFERLSGEGLPCKMKMES